MIQRFEEVATQIADLAWGPWLLVLLLGGGMTFLVFSRFTPFRFLPHAIQLLRGKFDDPDDPGQINHFKALSAALAGTIGMGNIAGVALAISIGGPGTIFWMWMTAIVGMATKFFTCSLSVMYRGKDSNGDLQGGPMYVIREALPKRMHFLAYMFAGVGLIGCLPALQSNQLVQIVRDLILIDYGWLSPAEDPFMANLACGLLLAGITAGVVFGGITRIAKVAAALVPSMSILYIGSVAVAIALNLDAVPSAFALIMHDAFTGDAVASGGLLAMILYGVRRGAYSNEAGMGTESLAHGAARTSEPIREGLVAMLGPVIDTLLVCTATALMILISGVWQTNGHAEGVTLTADAFYALLGPSGSVVVFVCTICFATTTIFTYSFYGAQCTSFLFGVERKRIYLTAYVSFILVAAVISIDAAVSIIDASFALMAIPTMVSALWLAPKVVEAANSYWGRMRAASDAS
jgi:AGCS family alanine or glycine:cation symporter